MAAPPDDENEDPKAPDGADSEPPERGPDPKPRKWRVIAKRVASLALTAVSAWMACGQHDAAPTNKAEAAIFVLVTLVRAVL